MNNVTDIPDPEFEQQCRTVVDQWRSGSNSFRLAVAELDRLLQTSIATGHRRNQAMAHGMLGYMQGYRGNLNAAIQYFQRARSIYDEIGDLQRVMITDLNTGISYRQRGDFYRALTLYRSVTRQSELLGSMVVHAKALSNEALVLVTLKRYRQAAQTLARVRRLADASNTPQDPNWPTIKCEMFYAQAMIDIAQGQPLAAWDGAVQGMEIARETRQAIHIGYANRTMALVVDALGHVPDEFIETYTADPDVYFSAAIGAFRDVRAQAELAQTVYMHGLSLGQRGQRVNAWRKLQQALVIFTRLGMVHDAADAAQAQLTITGRP
jgi:tetratricopeptide (TPR) repeat protein